MTRRTIDAVGAIPTACILAAQFSGSDWVWLGCNSVFLLYHLFFTKLRTQTLCSLALILICVYRLAQL